MADTRPLRRVSYRGPLSADIPGNWWDRLECGHQVRYDGANVSRRRCRDCPPTPLEPEAVPLFNVLE